MMYREGLSTTMMPNYLMLLVAGFLGWGSRSECYLHVVECCIG